MRMITALLYDPGGTGSSFFGSVFAGSSFFPRSGAVPRQNPPGTASDATSMPASGNNVASAT